MLNDDDMDLLEDIVDCVLKIVVSTKKIKYYYFENNHEKISTVERQLHIIGEASKKISKEARDIYITIPWDKMIGLRNRIAHEYGDLLIERLWYISKESVPELLSELNKIDELKDYIKQEKRKIKENKIYVI